jgi:hypothetical protein
MTEQEMDEFQKQLDKERAMDGFTKSMVATYKLVKKSYDEAELDDIDDRQAKQAGIAKFLLSMIECDLKVLGVL